MSGGEYNYLYAQVSDMAYTLKRTDIDPRRLAFQKFLELVSTAMRDIEWVDSCDLVPGDEHESIDAVFSFLGKDPQIVRKAAAFDKMKVMMKSFFENDLDGLTPKEKDEKAYETIVGFQEANGKNCEMGLCIHEGHKSEK